MTNVLFSEMDLSPELQKAITQMGFEAATPIQSEAIPVIRTGADIIARSQTGTGKTLAFAIPAIECIELDEAKPSIQVLILCPTRELALQADEEIRRLARYVEGITPVCIYGGAPIEKQCIALRRANVVIGTPGRVMDHMRRKTIKLNNLKMIVLDEADEMLNMGFREDIETILTDTPENRQTVLFSATMPPAIMRITKEFQTDPVLVEIDKAQVTIENIQQLYIDVPHAAKKDALTLLLQFYQPKRALIFTGTKKMADELTVFLNERGISAESIHSDIKQVQRTATMADFKRGKTTILIATDIAARGIDVNDIEYVINYDIPPNTEYYIHRIGRTGRAGKDGISISMCSSKREIMELRRIAVAVKSDIRELALPTHADIQALGIEKALLALEARVESEIHPIYTNMVEKLMEKGHSAETIAAAALAICYKDLSKPISKVSVTQFKHDGEVGSRTLSRSDKGERFDRGDRNDRSDRGPRRDDGAKTYKPRMDYSIIMLDIGSTSRVTPNHVIGAITDCTNLIGKMIGKVDIGPDQSLVEVPSDMVDEVLGDMRNIKICGKPTHACLLAGSPRKFKPAKKGGTPRTGDKAKYKHKD